MAAGPLREYRTKRDISRTPEPFGGAKAKTAPSIARFVVHKHAARRMHWDLRLEWGGVLWSWAVPEGPSLDPAVRRLAVEVEDHPVEYANFEGIIPKGEYGAGAVILWDSGVWRPIDDPEAGRRKGKLSFELVGHKLRGRWALARTRRTRNGQPPRDWLLIKKADEWATPETDDAFAEQSILSGLTVEELRDGPTRPAEIARALVAGGAPPLKRTPVAAKLMLAEAADSLPEGPGWFFELGHEGLRVLATAHAGRAKLEVLGGSVATAAFPEIARVLAALPFESFALDGVATVPGADGRASSSLLSRRVRLRRRADVERASLETPAILWVLDVLATCGLDTRPLPLRERKAAARAMLAPVGPVRFADHVEGAGAQFLKAARQMGIGRIAARRADAPYRAGRSQDWLEMNLGRGHRAQHGTKLTRLDKVFWPDEGYTKGDLVEYYRIAWGWLGRYLADRPVVLTRYPDGIGGKSFFQKDAPDWVPDWVRTERIWSRHAGRHIDYFVCDELESLLYIVNLGCIPLHVWSSRASSRDRPDWCILDLDPKQAPFSDVVTLANATRELCESIELPVFVKTSGATGLHVLVPLGRSSSFEQARSLGEIVARLIAADHPRIATTARALEARRGRVYLDTLQNGHGKLLVAPMSVRPLPAAPVSTPLRWEEVGPKLDPRAHTIRTIPRRMEALGDDPLAPVLELEPDLGRALAILGERLSRKAAAPEP
ncbi:MAG: DNA ligase [Deltaproteobacteria bacterium]|nr:DNA ligase [Deltaproteobacteria bacterium]